jgi:hypothetical protein
MVHLNKWLQIAPGELYEVKQNPYLHKMWKAYINTLWDDKFNAIHLNRTVESNACIMLDSIVDKKDTPLFLEEDVLIEKKTYMVTEQETWEDILLG